MVDRREGGRRGALAQKKSFLDLVDEDRTPWYLLDEDVLFVVCFFFWFVCCFSCIGVILHASLMCFSLQWFPPLFNP